MGTLKKIIWSLMTIVLILLGGFLLAISLVTESTRNFILAKFDNINYRYGLMAFGTLLLIFAIFLLIDIFVHRKEDRDYLIKSDSGDIYITRHALESLVDSSLNKFHEVSLDDLDVVIVGGEKIQVDLSLDVFGQGDYKELGLKIQREIIDGLKTLTGIGDISVELQLNKAKTMSPKELR